MLGVPSNPSSILWPSGIDEEENAAPDDSFTQQHGGCQFELVEIPQVCF